MCPEEALRSTGDGRVIGLPAPSIHLYPSSTWLYPSSTRLACHPSSYPDLRSGAVAWPWSPLFARQLHRRQARAWRNRRRHAPRLFVVTFSCTWPSSGGDVGLQSQPMHLLALIVKVVTWSRKSSLLPHRSPLQGLH